MNPYLDIVLRSVCVYFFMIIALRIFGKRELSQLNSSDIVLILLISNAVQNAMVGSDVSLEGGIIAAFSLFLINLIFKKVINKSSFLKQLVQSKPEILIHDGKVDFKTLSRLGITSDELDEVIREHGVENYKQVKLAMFENNGNISIISGNENLRQTQHKSRIHKTLGELNN
ncbi:MAG: YetF domain-containing protein [Bacteroidota bacterium]